MKKVILIFTLILFPVTSIAAYTANQVPSRMFGAGTVKFGVSTPPSDTCNYHGRHLKFDASTEAGKNMLSIFLAAKMSGKSINIWYTPSGSPGTTKDNGCSVSEMATVNEIGID